MNSLESIGLFFTYTSEQGTHGKKKGLILAILYSETEYWRKKQQARKLKLKLRDRSN